MKRLSVKSDPLEQTARYWMGLGKQKANLERETSRRRLSLSLDQGHEGVFVRCFKKMAVQVCMNHNHVFLPV
jgi:hypothetical protein